MTDYQIDELRRAAWAVVVMRRLGHFMDAGMAESCDWLGNVLDTTPGWDPPVEQMIGDGR